MSQIIFKYPIQLITSIQGVTLPKGARILSVQSQDNKPQIWALISSNPAPEMVLETRYFLICATGQPFEAEPGRELIYIGTFQLRNGALVFHLFEEVEKGREKRV